MEIDHEIISPAHLEQYFGVWAIQEDVFRAAVDRVNGIDLQLHLAAQGEKAATDSMTYQYPIEAGGIAVLRMTGPLMKYVSSLSGGTSTVWMRHVLRAAVNDERVRAILLRVDSPGGTVAGTQDLAADVAAVAKQKPLFAMIEDMGASAAYWVASQARKVYANATAMVGSIGTFAVIHDVTGMAAQMGVKVHVIRAGAFKGAGTPGTEITADQLAEWQRIVDELNEHFLRGVMGGRRMTLTKVRELADGRVHVGVAAEALGLIDGVRTFDEVLEDMRKLAGRETGPRASEQENVVMTQNVNTDKPADALEALAGNESPVEPVTTLESRPHAASLADLKAALPDSDPAFRESCQENSLTLDAAKSKWMARQQEEIADLKAKAAAPGVSPLSQKTAAATSTIGDGAVGDFNDLVKKKMSGGTLDRRQAIVAAAREQPALHEAYLAATNAPTSRVQDLIHQRFEME